MMRTKVLLSVGPVLLVVAAALTVVLRRARTVHPPVSPVVPRIDTAVDAPADTGEAGSLKS